MCTCRFDNNSYSKMVKLSIHFVSEHEPKSFNNWDVLWQFWVALVVRYVRYTLCVSESAEH